jgi:hypothetical protein
MPSWDEFMEMLGRRIAAIGVVVTGLLSLATVVVLIGAAAMYARLDQADLPNSEVVYQFARERLLTIGLVELLYTLGVLAALALIAHAWDKGATNARATSGWTMRAWALLWIASVAVLISAILVTPDSGPGYIVAATLAGLIIYFRARLGMPLFAFGDEVPKAPQTRQRRQIPHREVWVVLILVSLLFTIARVVEYSPGFARGTITLADEKTVTEAPPSFDEGIYIDTSNEKVFVVKTKPDQRLIIYPEDVVGETLIGETSPGTATEGEDSIIGTDFACLLPVCSDGDETVVNPPTP